MLGSDNRELVFILLLVAQCTLTKTRCVSYAIFRKFSQEINYALIFCKKYAFVISLILTEGWHLILSILKIRETAINIRLYLKTVIRDGENKTTP